MLLVLAAVLVVASVAAGSAAAQGAGGVTGPAFYVDGELYRTVGTPTDLGGTGAPAHSYDTIYEFFRQPTERRHRGARGQGLQRRTLARPASRLPVRVRSGCGLCRLKWKRRHRQRRGAPRRLHGRHDRRVGQRAVVRLSGDQAPAVLGGSGENRRALSLARLSASANGEASAARLERPELLRPS